MDRHSTNGRGRGADVQVIVRLVGPGANGEVIASTPARKKRRNRIQARIKNLETGIVLLPWQQAPSRPGAGSGAVLTAGEGLQRSVIAMRGLATAASGSLLFIAYYLGGDWLEALADGRSPAVPGLEQFMRWPLISLAAVMALLFVLSFAVFAIFPSEP